MQARQKNLENRTSGPENWHESYEFIRDVFLQANETSGLVSALSTIEEMGINLFALDTANQSMIWRVFPDRAARDGLDSRDAEFYELLSKVSISGNAQANTAAETKVDALAAPVTSASQNAQVGSFEMVPLKRVGPQLPQAPLAAHGPDSWDKIYDTVQMVFETDGESAVSSLRATKIDIYARDTQGKTIWDVANEKRDRRLLKLLPPAPKPEFDGAIGALGAGMPPVSASQSARNLSDLWDTIGAGGALAEGADDLWPIAEEKEEEERAVAPPKQAAPKSGPRIVSGAIGSSAQDQIQEKKIAGFYNAISERNLGYIEGFLKDESIPRERRQGIAYAAQSSVFGSNDSALIRTFRNHFNALNQAIALEEKHQGDGGSAVDEEVAQGPQLLEGEDELYDAVQERKIEKIIEVCGKYGANLIMPNAHGQTPLASALVVARDTRDDEMVELLTVLMASIEVSHAPPQSPSRSSAAVFPNAAPSPAALSLPESVVQTTPVTPAVEPSV